jgi:hypothetical protein
MLRTAMVSTRANRNYGPPDGIQPESLIRKMCVLVIWGRRNNREGCFSGLPPSAFILASSAASVASVPTVFNRKV